MKTLLKSYVRVTTALAAMRADRGATAIEYSLIFSLLAAIAVGGVGSVGGKF